MEKGLIKAKKDKCLNKAVYVNKKMQLRIDDPMPISTRNNVLDSLDSKYYSSEFEPVEATLREHAGR